MPKDIDPATFDRERLSQKDMAALLGVTPRTLRDWEEQHHHDGMFPRNRDGSYNLTAVFWFAVAKKKQVGGVA